MQIKLDPNSSVPMYKQIVSFVEENVANGTFVQGDKLPTFRELAEDLSISLGTVKNAYDELNYNGTISMTQGRGSFIAKGSENIAMSKKDMAMQIIDSSISQLLNIQISAQQIRIFIDLKLREIEDNKTTLTVMVVDCNIEALLMIEAKIAEIEGIETTFYLLDTFLKIDREALTGVDLFVTTFTHFEEVKEKLGSDERLMGIVVSTSLETMLQLSKTSRHDKLAIITSSQIFANIINSQYRKYINSSKTLPVYFLDNDISLDQLVKLYDKVIIPKSFYRIASPHYINMLNALQDNGLQVIYYDYETDKGSYTYLKERVDSLNELLVAKGE